MSYPPPPGTAGSFPTVGTNTNTTNTNTNTTAGRASHPSLPSRPPQSRASGFKTSFSKPAASAAPTSYGAPPSTYGAAPTSYSRPTAQPTYGAPPSTYNAPAASYNNAASSNYAAVSQGVRTGGSQAQGQSYGYYSQQTKGQSQSASAPVSYGPVMPAGYNATVPAGDNVSAAAAAAAAEYNSAGMAAQIAQWQSAYGPKDPNAPMHPQQIGPMVPGTDAAVVGAANGAEHQEKKKTVYREGGGKKWQDDTLLEWDPAHLRLFVGNLAGETTDDSLLKAFSRWKSVQKARVIRDKRSTKSKGYGFVSFSDSDDFFQAAKEMNGKYIQSHPVVVRKANTEIKATTAKDNRNNKWKKKNGGSKKEGTSGSGAGSNAGTKTGYEPGLLAVAGAGVTKPGQKTKNGLRLLG